MAAEQFFLSFPTAFSGNGLPEAGAQARFRLSGTTTAATVYSDAALTTPLTNPVVANGAGRLPTIYLDDTVTYRVDILDAQGVVLDSQDPYIPGASLPNISLTIGDYTTVSSKAALSALTASNGDVVTLADHDKWGTLKFTTTNFTSRITDDWAGVKYVAPDSDTTGASGVWRRANNGEVRIEDGGTTREALFSAFNLLDNDNDVNKITFSEAITTCGFGDERPADVTVANEAALNAASYADGDLIKATSENTYWLKTSGTLKKVGMGNWNGVVLQGVGKNGAITLEAGRDESLVNTQISNGRIVDVTFHGNRDNVTTAETCVKIKGYGIILNHVQVRYSDAIGITLRGVNGVMFADILTGYYTDSWGIKLDRNSATFIGVGWTESQAADGGMLVKPDVNSGDSDYTTDQKFWLRQAHHQPIHYNENSLNLPAIQVQGAFGTQFGEVVQFGTGNCLDINYVNNTDSTGIYQGSCGNLYGPTPTHNLKVAFDTQSRNNSVELLPSLFTTTEFIRHEWTDNGVNNRAFFKNSPEAYIPGAHCGDTSINTGISNWATKDGLSTADRIEGSMHHPLLDYNSSWTTGPSVLKLLNVDTANGGTAFQGTVDIEGSLAQDTPYWACISARLFGQAAVFIYLLDAGSPNTYFDWHTGEFVELANLSAYSYQRRVHMDDNHLFYQVPFTYTNGGARTGVKIGLRIFGAHGEYDMQLGHSWFSSIPNCAPTAYNNGVWLGTPDNPRFTTTLRPAAASWLVGLRAFNTTADAMQTCIDNSSSPTWS